MVLTEPSLLVYINKCCKPWTCETIKMIHTLVEIRMKSSNIKIHIRIPKGLSFYILLFKFRQGRAAAVGADPRKSVPSRLLAPDPKKNKTIKGVKA